MFRVAARRLALQQRCIHTAPAETVRHVQRRRIVFAAGAVSAVAFTYFAWRISSPGNKIALDSHKDPATRNIPPSPPPQQDDGKPQEVSKTSSDDVSEEEGEAQEPDAAGPTAYNPDTGEINWDCPCLGGMAHGTCGMQFREAFSCFVHSGEEPKGIDCVEKFKAMQDCFREHPDEYGEEIADDDDEENENENPQTLVEPETTTTAKEAAPETLDTPSKKDSKVDQS